MYHLGGHRAPSEAASSKPTCSNMARHAKSFVVSALPSG